MKVSEIREEAFIEGVQCALRGVEQNVHIGRYADGRYWVMDDDGTLFSPILELRDAAKLFYDLLHD